jgi:AcrR family transcriptional regulator
MQATARRRQLLDVALDVFGARGFYGTSVEEIAERAGVTKPVVYQHFDSKRDLYFELVTEVGNRLAVAVTEAATGAGRPRDQVLAGFRAYFSWVERHPSAFQLLVSADITAGDGLGPIMADFEDRMAAVIEPLIEADVAPDHRRMLAYSIVGLAEVTSRRWAASMLDTTSANPVEPVSAELVARRLAELAWAGLRGVHHDP